MSSRSFNVLRMKKPGECEVFERWSTWFLLLRNLLCPTILLMVYLCFVPLICMNSFSCCVFYLYYFLVVFYTCVPFSCADFTFIYKMFFAPLPSDVDEFTCSLRLAFPQIFDLTHMMKEVVPAEKATNLSAARSYLRNRFSTTINMEVPYKGQAIDRCCTSWDGSH